MGTEGYLAWRPAFSSHLLPDQRQLHGLQRHRRQPGGDVLRDLPQLGQAWNIAIAPSATTIASIALADFAQLPPVPLFGGEALILPPVVDISGGVNLPNNLQFLGAELFVQGVRLNFDGVSVTFELTNAIAAVVGK